ncbi:hypothetical protein VTL71DRAFT_9517 [Oculimacula yallundae]|uniref:Heterokaryon incompatibility domain-containing protein n=1 Tax=Oculimacula yallundae TaxID=86028 RepID=A0ABR4BTF1_9HELO
MMRLLHYRDGDLSLTTFSTDKIPQKYATLSHTWERRRSASKICRKEEPVGRRLAIRRSGSAENRRGVTAYNAFGWTYCIDKSSSAKLTEAINSMLRWYCGSTKCYVYLSDISRPAGDSDLAWEAAFRRSKWFTRGWTLQELIAPRSVEFFSVEGELLGNKSTLEEHICEIARLPAEALRGSPLSDFGITSRMSWAEHREITREEDQAYLLLGILMSTCHLSMAKGTNTRWNDFKRPSIKGQREQNWRSSGASPVLWLKGNSSVPEFIECFASKLKDSRSRDRALQIEKVEEAFFRYLPEFGDPGVELPYDVHITKVRMTIDRIDSDISTVLNHLKLGSQDRDIMRRALLWLTITVRPLRLDELSEAIVLEDSDCDIDSDARLHSPEILIKLANGLLAYDYRSNLVTKYEEKSQDYPLLVYAAHNWPLHILEPGKDDWLSIQQLFSTRSLPYSGNYGWWLRMIGGYWTKAYFCTDVLYYAASYGFTGLVEAVLRFSNDVNLETAGG